VAVGRDKHPRERQARALARKKGKRPLYQRVLIVCEGSKTEPIYFDDIRKQNRVPTAHIRVIHADGTQPRQVVDFAEQTFRETKEYDWVFAVFDRDDHTTYADAIRRAATLDKKLHNDERKQVRFCAIPSVPCFELWLLLHFTDMQAFHHRTRIIGFSRTYISDYEKGAENIYAITEPALAVAIGRAKRLVDRFEPIPGDDPYTCVHEVVELLRSIRPVGR
jgi:hypothetical protein